MTRRPIVSPTFSPSVAAMRAAAARAARRRGSSRMRRLPSAQGSSSSASGARVVLPAPGGATSTARGRSANAARSEGRAASIGRGGTERDIAPLFARRAGKGKRPRPKPRCRPRESGDPEIIERIRSIASAHPLDPRFRGGDRAFAPASRPAFAGVTEPFASPRGRRARSLLPRGEGSGVRASRLKPRSARPSAASRGRA